MNSIELVFNDNNHYTLKINGKDAGALYLTQDEYLDLLLVLKRGAPQDLEIIELGTDLIDDSLEEDDEE